MNRIFYISILLLFISTSIEAQRVENGQVVLGNEWIDYDKTYFKIRVAEDAIYKVSKEELEAAGFPVSSTPMSDFQLIGLGDQVAIQTTTDGIAQDDDFLLFYGKKNRGEVDRYAYETDDIMLNPEYSIISDTAAYFLTINPGNNLRYETVNTDLSSNTLTSEEYILFEEKRVLTNRLFKPLYNGGDKISYSHMDESEGYGTIQKATTNIKLDLNNLYKEGPDTDIYLRGAVSTIDNHNIKLTIGNEVIFEDEFSGYKVIDIKSQLSSSSLGSSVTLSLESLENKNLVSIASATYPHQLKLANTDYSVFKVSPSEQTQYYEFEGSANEIKVLDITNNKYIIPAEVDSDKFGFYLASSQSERTLVISKTTNSTISINQRKFTDYIGLPNDYVMITNSLLYEPFNGVDQLQRYADYRASNVGGNYNPVLIDVNQLYDQYAYGIDRHFVAIKHFGLQMKQSWTNVKAVILLGKGVQYSSNRGGSTTFSYVPPFGSPGSDNLLFTDFGDQVPYFPLGRVAAKSPEEVSWYLDKVIAYDENYNNPQTIEGRLWQKRVVHMSGGRSSDFLIMESKLAAMENVIEGTEVGTKVKTFYLHRPNNQEEQVSDQVLGLIQDGIDILTFFGHAGTSVVDFAIAPPNKFENKGKYPLVISLGCYSGNCHTPGGGISEDYVIEKEQGAIGFLATAGTAYTSILGSFGQELYRQYGTDSYGKTIGESINKALKNINPNGVSNITFVEQLNYHGDPAVKLYHTEGPDYIPDFSTAKMSKEPVETLSESIEFCIDIVNIGKYKESKDLQVKLMHYKADNSVALDTIFKVDAPAFVENYCFNLKFGDNSYVGKNKITIEINPNVTIEELPKPDADNNNTLAATGGISGYEFNVLSTSLIPTLPYNYSIMSERNVELIVSSFNAFSNLGSTIIELDTTPDFNSSAKQNVRINGGVSPLKWNVSLLENNNQVYYWRVSNDTILSGEKVKAVWDVRSFTYIEDSEQGWNQSHWGQFDDNEFDQLVINEDKVLDFDKWYREHRIRNDINENIFFTRAGVSIDSWRKLVPKGFGIIVLDKVSGFLLLNQKIGEFDSQVSNKRTFFHEYKVVTASDRKKFYDALQGDFFRGKTIIVTSMQQENQLLDIKSWTEEDNTLGQNFKSVLSSLNSTIINEIYDYEHPNFLFFIDGDSNQIFKEFITDTDVLEESEVLVSKFFQGEVKTKEIGPAISFGQLTIQMDESTNVINIDSLEFQIYGLDKEGKEQIILPFQKVENIDLSFINSLEYSTIKIGFRSWDPYNHSPVDNKVIKVNYTPYPDILLKANKDGHKNSYKEGELLSILVGVDNLTETNIVELYDVSLLLTDESNNKLEKVLYYESLEGGASKDINFEIETKGKSGNYSVEVQVNKSRNILEQQYNNNLGLFNLEIEKDKINPSMEITFDGISIMDFDIVSAKPQIRITLSDENSYLILDDSTKFNLIVTDPNGLATNYSNESSEINFTPAESTDNNTALIEFSPEFLIDGQYILSVAGKDVTGNDTGDNPYKINFRVINEEMVSQVFNYPNPFSTSTQFIFTLTGSEMPESMIIRIYTISGKVIKEITADQIGPLNIGVNRSEYKWDGTDEYGNKLGNGVYLYKAIIKGREIEDYKIFKDGKSLDKYFKNGFGKLVITR